ncbi:MAG TPA: THUMP domain-containing protein, partial [Thermoplasmata archaeon]|nr:THUMP domain-containing protein [Thermoplasmata archaeon]
MLYLVRYGEIAIKSPKVRDRFELRLVENVKSMLAKERVDCIVRRDRGRIFVSVNDDERSKSRTVSAITRTFGIVSFSPVLECTSKLDAISVLAVRMASDWSSCSFAIRPRRAGTHPYSSRELAVAVGRAIQDSAGKRTLDVDLDNPDHELHIEVRDARGFLFEEILAGPGGLPVGSQGRVGTVLATEADAAAAWMTLKRGCALSVCGEEKLAKMLEKWAPLVKRVPAGPRQERDRL